MQKLQNGDSTRYLLLVLLFIYAKLVDFLSAFVLSKFLTMEIIYILIGYIILFSILAYLGKKFSLFGFIGVTFLIWLICLVMLFETLKLPGREYIFTFGIGMIPFGFLVMYLSTAQRVYKYLQKDFPRLGLLRIILTFIFAFLYYINLGPISGYALLLMDFMILWMGLYDTYSQKSDSGKSFGTLSFIMSSLVFLLISGLLISWDIVGTIGRGDNFFHVFAIFLGFYSVGLMFIFSQIESAIGRVKHIQTRH